MTHNIPTVPLGTLTDFLASFAENSTEVYWLSSPDFERIAYISPAFETVWGRPRSILYETPELWITYLHPDDVENHHPIHAMKERVQREGGKARYNESYRIIRPDGEVRWIYDRGFPVVDQNTGICQGVTGVAIDVTDQKKVEQYRLEAIAAEERVGTIQLIGAAIAHELRTPLRSIASHLDGAQMHMPALIKSYEMAKAAGLQVPKIHPSIFKALEDVFTTSLSEIHAASNIIDMLLIKADLKNIETSGFTTCSMNQCLDGVMRRYHFEGNEKELIEIRKQEDFHFKGDETLIVHVFFNLIKNALHYLKVARKGNIQIWYQKNKDCNEVHFKDTGTGISAESLSRIFERFYSKTTHGTGVGLAFCKMVMNSMGGDIVCDSKEGEYTEFTLTFPPLDKNGR